MDDLEARLDAPYQGPLHPRDAVEVDRDLGFDSSAITSLEQQIFDDLDAERHGIGWWADRTPWDRRILVSDYLYTSMTGLRKGLRHSVLHLHELKKVEDQTAEKWRAHALRVGQIEPPPPSCLRDDIDNEFADMHLCGFFRALSGALDSIAVAIVGVLPVPIGIQGVNWRSLRRNLESLAKKDRTAVGTTARGLLDLTTQGPPGWIEWGVELRNLLVHRPPRTRFGQVALGQVHSSGTQGELAIVHRLPLDPERSEVEVWTRHGHPFLSLLPEPQERTMSRLIYEAAKLTSKVCPLLEQRWSERRRQDDGQQPVEKQWPERVTAPSGPSFQGFFPATLPEAGEMRVHPEMVRRLRAASVDGANILNWDRHLKNPTKRLELAMPARIRWLTKGQGGRDQPPTGETYTTVARFNDPRADWSTDAWSVHVAFTSAPTLAIVSFLALDGPHDLLQSGVGFELYEGTTKVADVLVE